MNKDEEIKQLNIKAIDHYVRMAKVCFEIFSPCPPSKVEYMAFMKGVLAEMKTSVLWKHCTCFENLAHHLKEANEELNDEQRLCEEIAHYIAVQNTKNKNQEYFKNEKITTTLDFPNAGVTYNVKIELTACEKK